MALWDDVKAAAKASILANYDGAYDAVADQLANPIADAVVEGVLGGGDPDAFHQSVAGEIAGLSAPGAGEGDHFLMEDNSNSNVKAQATCIDIGYRVMRIANQFAGLTQKSSPASGDHFLMEDSAASNAKKRITWANILSAIQAATRKKILYGATYPSTASNASSVNFTYWVSFFDYSYFYANTTHSTEANKQMPIPGPGNITKVFAKVHAGYVSTKPEATPFQLRKNGANVSGASFSIPASPAQGSIHQVTGSWPYNDGDLMCLRAITGPSSGNLYMRAVGLEVEV